MDNYWQDLQIESKVIEILKTFQYSDTKHHGHPFVTAYQIAIEFADKYAEATKKIGKPIGGKGTGEDSLARYLANQLSRHIKDGSCQDVEMAFLHTRHITDVTFMDEIIASAPRTIYDISIFRLK